MSVFERIVEERIQAAIQEGAFDHLAGSGKPLPRPLDEENASPEDWLAYHLLKNQGFSLPWIELRQELLSEQSRLRAKLDQGSNIAAEEFRSQAAALNRRIIDYNLQAPSARFHLLLVDVERELARLNEPCG